MLASLLLTLTLGLSSSSEPVTTIFGRTNGYLVLPARTVCDGQVRDLRWSPDNRFLVAIRSQYMLDRQKAKRLVDLMKTPNSQPSQADLDLLRNSVVVWSTAEGKAHAVWTSKTSQDDCEQVALAGASLYLVVRQSVPSASQAGETRQMSLLRCVLGSPSIQLVKVFEPGIACQVVAVDPANRSILIDLYGTGGVVSQAVVSGNILTVVGNPSQIPKELQAQLKEGSSRWVIDGSGHTSDNSGLVPRTEKELTILLKTLRSSNSDWRATIQSLVCDDPEKPGKAYETIANGVGSRFALAWDNSALAYTIDNFLVVRDLIPVPLDVVRHGRDAAERAQTLSSAKQVGMAMIMFATDNDDVLPGNLTTDQIDPYIKNTELLNGFVYTFGGGNLTELRNPADTELGYVTGKGGRAVIYADGHVVWKDD